MPSVAITPGRMESFARALDRAVASAVAPTLPIGELCSSFVAIDEDARSWTLNLESHRWSRLDGERWIDDDPPQHLWMDSELRGLLETLEATAARAIMKGAEIHLPREAWFRTADAPAEAPEIHAPLPALELVTPPQLNLVRERAPLPEPARSSESISVPASVAPVMMQAVPVIESPVIEQVPLALASSEGAGTAEPETRTSETIPLAPEPEPVTYVLSSEVFGLAEPTAPALVETQLEPELETAWEPEWRSAWEPEWEPVSEPEPEPEPLLEPVPMINVAPTGNALIPIELAPSVASLAEQAAIPIEEKAPSLPVMAPRPVEETLPLGPEIVPMPVEVKAPSLPVMAPMPAAETPRPRRAIPEAHRRFAGPGFTPVSEDLEIPAWAAMARSDVAAAPDRRSTPARLPLPVPPWEANSRRRRHVPTSIAPRLTSEHPDTHQDRVPILLCTVVTVLFLALASLRGNGRDYVGAVLFGILTVTLLVLHHARSERD